MAADVVTVRAAGVVDALRAGAVGVDDAEAVAAYERFIEAEGGLLALLQERLRQDEQLLAGMRQGG